MNKKYKERLVHASNLTSDKIDKKQLSRTAELVRGLDDVIENTKFTLTGREMTSLFKARNEFRWQCEKIWDNAHREVIVELLESVDEYRAELRKLKKQINKK